MYSSFAAIARSVRAGRSGIESRLWARFFFHLYDGYRVSFSGVEWSGRGVDHPLPSSAEDKEIVELYLYFPPVFRELFCGEPSYCLQLRCVSCSGKVIIGNGVKPTGLS